ncbi:hypothetical protein [uncultured Gimesia sp.]|uniref:hypothetical protein n=1 Tax=uncultured Gimesia sp. TaxID=1678688 RepID=UPI002638F17F|nr:hypothetical protein [uncultured Gimesia sp.]
MASIEKQSSANWIVRFRFPVGGKVVKFNRSLKTKSERVAEQRKAQIEETIYFLESGRLALPDGATDKEVAAFIVSGGILTEKPRAIKSVALETLWADYKSS